MHGLQLSDEACEIAFAVRGLSEPRHVVHFVHTKDLISRVMMVMEMKEVSDSSHRKTKID